MPMTDLTGQVFGYLTALAPTTERRGGQVVWRCRCVCGKEHLAVGWNLTQQRVKSCGCYRRIWVAERNGRHGAAARGRVTPEYRTWLRMKARCYNPRAGRFDRYGGRGIVVAKRWLDDFGQFLADMGPKPSPRHELDRINNDHGYEPGNCRWASRQEQMRNTSATLHLTFRGETLSLVEWSQRLRIPTSTLWNRLVPLGWSIEQAFAQPAKKRA